MTYDLQGWKYQTLSLSLDGDDSEDEIDGFTIDFHRIFLQSDFHGNPERAAHYFFKSGLGEITLTEVILGVILGVCVYIYAYIHW